MTRKIIDKLMLAVFLFFAIATTAFLIYFILYIVSRGYTAFSWKFLSTAPRGIKMEGGVWPMIVSSVYLTALTLLVAVPLGVGGGIYLSEYAGQGRIVQSIRFAIDLLSSVPSIVFGLFGLVFFVQLMGLKYSMIAGALTLTLMVLPIVLKISEESFRAVPQAYREASLALGATKEQTIFRVILPTAIAGILTGAILAAGRAFGETAAVLYTAGMAPQTPVLPLEGGRTLSVHLYLLATTGNIEKSFQVAVVLLVIILGFNLTSNWVMNRYRRKFSSELI
ncbi:MAG: phosphate ABC transporter permease PstA [Actinomycetota bacterium]